MAGDAPAAATAATPIAAAPAAATPTAATVGGGKKRKRSAAEQKELQEQVELAEDFQFCFLSLTSGSDGQAAFHFVRGPDARDGAAWQDADWPLLHAFFNAEYGCSLDQTQFWGVLSKLGRVDCRTDTCFSIGSTAVSPPLLLPSPPLPTLPQPSPPPELTPPAPMPSSPPYAYRRASRGRADRVRGLSCTCASSTLACSRVVSERSVTLYHVHAHNISLCVLIYGPSIAV
jgi:hypothetical protein